MSILIQKFQTGGTTTDIAPTRPEYQTKLYNGKPYDKLGLNERRILDYRYGYTGMTNPDGTVQYNKWEEGQGVGQNYYGKSVTELNEMEKANAANGTYSAHNKWAYMVDPETNTTWFVNNKYLGAYPTGVTGEEIKKEETPAPTTKKKIKGSKKGGILY